MEVKYLGREALLLEVHELQVGRKKSSILLSGRVLLDLQSTTNKMQHFTIYFCKTVHVSDGFSVHHQELKTAWLGWNRFHPSQASSR